METLLNRWRGTGLIFSISKLNITGVMIYALYLCLLFGLITEWYIGLITAIGFLIGESFGWGKWIGALITDKEIDLQKEYDDLEGYNFPYIHRLAECFVGEREHFLDYCRVALFIRGAIWALCLYLALALFSYISLIEYIILAFIYGLGFPLACWLSTKKSFSFKNKFISIATRWETMEVYYGVIHFVCNLYLLLRIFIWN